MENWFVLHTKPYSERKVARQLERYDIETYLPETEGEPERSGTTPIPFFPGYMFIYLDPGKVNPNHWRFTPGVRYILKYGEEPVVIKEELIHAIQKQIEALADRRQQPQGRFKRGDQVRITSGPLEGLVAIFEGPAEPAKRVRILLEIISRYRRIAIAASDLEKVDVAQDKPQTKRPRRTRGRGRPIHH